MEIGIIGFGNFGRFIAKHLVDKFSVFVNDDLDMRNEAREIGANFVSLGEASSKDIVILAVPMECFKECLIKIKKYLKKDSIVIDVCSLKMFSCNLMKEILPENIEIIGTHPLFGPNSAVDSIAGLKIAVILLRCSKSIDSVIKFLESLDLKVIITTAEEHDKQMAVSQALTHFIGQAMINSEIKRIELSTKTFDTLMNLSEIIAHDSPTLLNNMQTMNPFAKLSREKFIFNLNEINKKFI